MNINDLQDPLKMKPRLIEIQEVKTFETNETHHATFSVKPTPKVIPKAKPLNIVDIGRD
jgi:hypothetical protein